MRIGMIIGYAYGFDETQLRSQVAELALAGPMP